MQVQNPRILLVEDDLIQAKLVKRVLDKSTMQYFFTHVSSGEECLDLIKNENEFDIILLDYSLPEMDGLSVLRSLKKIKPDLPVIIITAHGSEDIAVQIMKEGAFDYVIKKDNYVERIPYVIKENLQRLLFEQEKARLESQLRESEERYRNLFETSLDGIIILNPEAQILSANPASSKITGYSRDEMANIDLGHLFYSSGTKESFQEMVKSTASKRDLEFEITTKDNKKKFVLASFSHIKNDHGDTMGIGLVFKDITERKLAEQRIEELLKETEEKSNELERVNKMLENYITGRRTQV
ncbi:MAG: response regulator [bacterium]